jgi:hypothetical protein
MRFLIGSAALAQSLAFTVMPPPPPPPGPPKLTAYPITIATARSPFAPAPIRNDHTPVDPSVRSMTSSSNNYRDSHVRVVDAYQQ